MPPSPRGSSGLCGVFGTPLGRRARRPAVFVSDEATLDVSFDVALARLTALAGTAC